ncbi:DNA ligase [Actinoplanes sp. ATCC 53533]|nr:DNA ligase [Actinoplanes sp. ATCC 53533]
MLAAAGPLPRGSGWAYEMKVRRCQVGRLRAARRGAAVQRNANDITSHYPELQELGMLLDGRDAVLDGEIVALEPGERPSFSRLQARMHVAEPSRALLDATPVSYYVFDVLRLGAEDVTSMPYITRRDVLDGLGLSGVHMRVPRNFVNVDGQSILEAAELAGLEGVVAKRLSAPYRPGKRSTDFTKVPLVRTQEVIVIGWRLGEGRRAGTLGSVLLAVYDERDQLVYAGDVGTGFTDIALRHLHQQLEPLERTTPPVPDVPRERARRAIWVEPVLVGEVEFRSWTPENRLRHSSWRELRPDRSPSSVHRAPTPAVSPAPDEVEGALKTPDEQWQVEVVRRGDDQFFRLLHNDNVVDGLTIDGLEKVLAEAGIDMSDLIEAKATEVTQRQHGVA